LGAPPQCFAFGLARARERKKQADADFRSGQIVVGLAARTIVVYRVTVYGGVRLWFLCEG